MTKKILASLLAVMFLFVVLSMTVGAYYGYQVDGYICNYTVNKNVLVNHFGTYPYVRLFAVVTYDDLTAPVNSISVSLQCVVLYTDGTSDISNEAYLSNGGSADVYYDTTKTVWYVDIEVHVFDNNVYMGTVSDQIAWGSIS